MSIIEPVRNFVRHQLRIVAVLLNRVSGGKLTPNAVTLFGLFMHIPIAWLIATGTHQILAGVLLVVFGLFDVVDGELARLQHRASAGGMVLDATTDRMKEVLLYIGVAFQLASGNTPIVAVWAVAACGASICVSYVKAKGEAAIASAGSGIPHDKLNRLFKDGLLTFEVRMAILVTGLLFGQLLAATIGIAILSALTAAGRLERITRALEHV
jgi:archaetidylinositol phosphate synthase